MAESPSVREACARFGHAAVTTGLRHLMRDQVLMGLGLILVLAVGSAPRRR
ncbi:hypothetical protein ACFY1L_28270 [Streptomyces sp. NPDC001663]|uniref:hypothetical protein n=1 Tax=Streptomyces sp. NPDC001663 TaxID=3364597 RepID=UPI0036C4A4FF